MVLSAQIITKVMSQVHDKPLVKTEKSLNLWLKDMNHKRVPINRKVLQEKALSHYVQLIKLPTKEGQASDGKEFKERQGWLNGLRNCFNLKTVELTGESASTNKEAAQAYPELKKITEEAGYHLEQVFNADETCFFSKKCPTTHIFRNLKDKPLASKQLKTISLYCFVAMLLGI
jgi:hypothetical protein